MTQTSNLGLNVWSVDDPVNVGQINQNFQKLDAASTANKYVKLMEVNDTVGGANQIDVNLTGIDLRDYAYLELTGSMAGCSEDSNYSNKVYPRLNNIVSYCYCTVQSWNTGVDFRTTSPWSYIAMLMDSNGYNNGSISNFRLYLYAVRNFVVYQLTSFQYCHHGDSGNQNALFSAYYGMVQPSFLTPGALSSVNFPLLGSKVYVPGSNICVYGVKK